MKEKLIYITIGVIIISAFFLLLNMWSFKIKVNIPSIQNAIEDSLDKQSSDNQVTILKIKNIDSYKLVLFEDQYSRLGDAVLKRGLNNKYRIEGIGLGTNMIRYKTLKTENRTIFWVMGKNYGIKEIRAVFTGYFNKTHKSYKIKIPKEQSFIEYCIISDEIDSTYPQRFEILDNNNIK